MGARTAYRLLGCCSTCSPADFRFRFGAGIGAWNMFSAARKHWSRLRPVDCRISKAVWLALCFGGSYGIGEELTARKLHVPPLRVGAAVSLDEVN